MIRVVRADGLIDRLRFFNSPARFLPGESGLAALRDGRLVARLVTGSTRQPGMGYISRLWFEEDEEALQALTRAVCEIQRERGAAKLVGPLSADLGGFGNGMVVRGFEGEGTLLEQMNPPYYPRLMEKCGWEAEEELLDYRVNMADFPAEYCARVARRAQERYGIRGQGVRAMSRRELYDRLYALYSRVESTAENDLARQIDRLHPLMKYTQLAMREGECVGAMIVLNKKKTFRVATLHVAPQMRNHGVTAVLFDALKKSLPPEVRTLQAATVAQGNERSQMNVKAAGATPFRAYQVYQCNV